MSSENKLKKKSKRDYGVLECVKYRFWAFSTPFKVSSAGTTEWYCDKGQRGVFVCLCMYVDT